MAKIELPRQDHYEVARDKGLGELKRRWDGERLRALGAEVTGEEGLELASLCWRFRIRLDPFSMALLPAGEECGVHWQILALDYLNADPPPALEHFVSFADFVEARTYLKVFEGRVSGRLARGVGRDAQEFARAAQRCGGVLGGEAPPAYLFRFFPRLELQVVRYEGEEDLPTSCTVLFPDNAMQVLSPECVIVAAELLVSALKGKRPCD